MPREVSWSQYILYVLHVPPPHRHGSRVSVLPHHRYSNNNNTKDLTATRLLVRTGVSSRHATKTKTTAAIIDDLSPFLPLEFDWQKGFQPPRQRSEILDWVQTGKTNSLKRQLVHCRELVGCRVLRLIIIRMARTGLVEGWGFHFWPETKVYGELKLVKRPHMPSCSELP